MFSDAFGLYSETQTSEMPGDSEEALSDRGNNEQKKYLLI